MYVQKRLRPYIGITDFTDNSQVKRMLDIFRANRKPGSVRRLHVGVMMSFKTLYGLETQWSSVFPPKETIASIFTPVDDPDQDNYRGIMGDLMFTLHYADYGSPLNLFKNLMDALNYAGPHIDALQLDMIWPDPDVLFEVNHSSRKNLEFILQIGKKAFEEVGNDPDKVVERLFPYRDTVTHILLDKSMGKGLGMDAQELLPFARAIRSEYPHFGIAVAGGLGPGRLHLLEQFEQEFPNVNVDAEGRLRPSGSVLDPIDWDMAGQYLVEALEMLG